MSETEWAPAGIDWATNMLLIITWTSWVIATRWWEWQETQPTHLLWLASCRPTLPHLTRPPDLATAGSAIPSLDPWSTSLLIIMFILLATVWNSCETRWTTRTWCMWRSSCLTTRISFRITVWASHCQDCRTRRLGAGSLSGPTWISRKRSAGIGNFTRMLTSDHRSRTPAWSASRSSKRRIVSWRWTRSTTGSPQRSATSVGMRQRGRMLWGTTCRCTSASWGSRMWKGQSGRWTRWSSTRGDPSGCRNDCRPVTHRTRVPSLPLRKSHFTPL